MAATITPNAPPTAGPGGRWAGIRHAVKVNTSLRIDPDVFMLAKAAAERRGMSLNIYFERAISEACDRDIPAGDPVRAQPEP